MNESTDGTQTPPPVMPTKSLPRAKAGVGIHDLAARTKASRRWLAFAHHDVLAHALRYSTLLFLGVALPRRMRRSPASDEPYRSRCQARRVTWAGRRSSMAARAIPGQDYETAKVLISLGLAGSSKSIVFGTSPAPLVGEGQEPVPARYRRLGWGAAVFIVATKLGIDGDRHRQDAASSMPGEYALDHDPVRTPISQSGYGRREGRAGARL